MGSTGLAAGGEKIKFTVGDFYTEINQTFDYFPVPLQASLLNEEDLFPKQLMIRIDLIPQNMQGKISMSTTDFKPRDDFNVVLSACGGRPFISFQGIMVGKSQTTQL